VKARLASLDKMLRLDLPAWDQKPWEFSLGPPAQPGMPNGPRNERLKKCAEERRLSYDALIPAVLMSTADYDPDDFQKTFAELARLLP
jgi:hypothetical protein